MAITENPRIFLADFGSDVTLTPTSGSAKTTRGLFDAAYSAAAGMGTSAPQLMVPSVDVPANITRGTAVIPAGQPGAGTWRVDRPESDGTGWITLLLEA